MNYFRNPQTRKNVDHRVTVFLKMIYKNRIFKPILSYFYQNLKIYEIIVQIAPHLKNKNKKYIKDCCFNFLF